MQTYSGGHVAPVLKRITNVGVCTLAGDGVVPPTRGRTGARTGLLLSLGLLRRRHNSLTAPCVGDHHRRHLLGSTPTAHRAGGGSGSWTRLARHCVLTALRSAMDRVSALDMGPGLATRPWLLRSGVISGITAIALLLVPQCSWGASRAVERADSSGHYIIGRPAGATYSVSSGGALSPALAAGGTNVTTTFRVSVSPRPAAGWWSVTGLGRRVRVGAVMHRDSAGRVDGYWTVADAGPITISGTPAFPALPSWSSYAGATSTTIVALYANLNNPATPPAPSAGGVISPGTILDLSVYNAGTGTGWVARDHRTGNGLLLKVSGANNGTSVCNTDSPSGCNVSTTISQLNAEGPFAFATSLGSTAAVRTALYQSIPVNEPMVAMGCIAQSADGTGHTSPCLGGGLQVSLTPIGVISGQALSSGGHRGGATSGDWSPAGTYYLYLTGVMIYG